MFVKCINTVLIQGYEARRSYEGQRMLIIVLLTMYDPFRIFLNQQIHLSGRLVVQVERE